MSTETDLGNTDTILPVVAAPSASRDRARRYIVIGAAALGTLVIVACVALLVTTRLFVASGRVAPGVTISGLEVGGMTREDALSALQVQWLPALPEAVKVTFPDGNWDARREELGVSFRLEDAVEAALRVGREGGLFAQAASRIRPHRPVQVAVPVTIDDNTLAEAIGGLSEVVDRDPVDADIRIVSGEVQVVPGQVGRTLNVEATATAIKNALTDPAATEVAATVETREPSVTAEDLSHLEVVLGSYSTPYNAGRVDRSHNLRLATGKLNHTVLRPGQEFSFNQTVGERGVEAGYREAPIFIEGEVRPSMGGGICQVATTTYNAALLANLEFIERHHHSRPVDYAPTGRDATVYWGQYDLRFRNSLKHPVLILASVGSSEVTISILGSREDDADVEITRQGLSRVSHGVKEISDPQLEQGKREEDKPGRDGWRVSVYRKATRGGQVLRDEKLHDDYYAPQTQVVRVGTKPPAQPAPQPGAAATPASPAGQSPTGSRAPAPARPPAASSRAPSAGVPAGE